LMQTKTAKTMEDGRDDDSTTQFTADRLKAAQDGGGIAQRGFEIADVSCSSRNGAEP